MKKRNSGFTLKLKRFAAVGLAAVCASSLATAPVYAIELENQLINNEKKVEQSLKKNGSYVSNISTAYNYLEGTTKNTKKKSQTYPSTYDLRNVNGKSYVTPVKFQNPWGTCWGFATIAASETSIAYELNLSPDQIDLSELHLAWFALNPLPADEKNYPSQAGEGVTVIGNEPLNNGGMLYTATSVISSGIGPVGESLVPYKGANGTILYDPNGNPFCYSKDDDWSVDESKRFNQTIELEESSVLPSPAVWKTDANGNNYYEYNAAGTEAIKSELMAGRAVSIAFSADTSRPSEPETEETKPETETPETEAPETESPETEAPETEAPETEGPETEAPETEAPETQAPETQAPETESPETQESVQNIENSTTTMSMRSNSSAKYINTDTWAHYTYDDGMANHAVTIVGWDDNYSASNFLEGHQPPANGAWIVKNSWGAESNEFPHKNKWGNDGYFYLS